MLKVKCFPSKNAAAACGTYHHITPDCWSINTEQMNALLAPLCWNVSVSLRRKKGTIATPPVSYSADNKLSWQSRHVTVWHEKYIDPWSFHWCVCFFCVSVHLCIQVISPIIYFFMSVAYRADFTCCEVFWCTKNQVGPEYVFICNQKAENGCISAGMSSCQDLVKEEMFFSINTREISTPRGRKEKDKEKKSCRKLNQIE